MLVGAAGVWLALLTEEDYLARWTLFAAFVGAACFAAAVFLRMAAAIPLGVLAIALPYVGILALEQETLHTQAPALAAVLFAATELAYWSLELRGGLADEPGTYLRRLALLVALVVGMFFAGTAVLALIGGTTTSGAGVDAIGAAGAIAVVALLALAAASRRQGS